MVERDPAKAGALLDTLQGAATDALEDLRDLARGIYPPLLADKGLVTALEAQARKAVVPVTVEGDGVGRFPADVESAVYFSCLEALQNIGKYAEATNARITLSDGSGELRFEVRDDGRGFDPSTTNYGTGLQGIADRVAALGGELVVTSTPGDGTALAGRLPVGEVTG
jgi:signal transduction histidine kinase